MSRANPLPPDARRRALIDATRPLLLEYGPGVSTRQIAEAASVAEGTIFRVFASKQDLIDAVVAEEMSINRLTEQLATVPAPDCEALVFGLIAALHERYRSVRALMAVVGHRKPTSEGPPDPSQHSAHHEHVSRTIEALAQILAPYEKHLSITPQAAAAAMLALSFGSTLALSLGGDSLDAAAVSRILLHGIAKEN